MKNVNASMVAALFCALLTVTWSHAESDNSGSDSKSHAPDPAWAKVDKARAEAEEAKALAQKAEQEAKLQEALLHQKMISQIAQAELDAELVNKSAKKAEQESRLANALAARTEAILRDTKARTELKALEQAAPAICESRQIAAKCEKLETEMKLAKLTHEKETMGASLK